MILTRRSLLRGLFAAPAIVRPGLLMPISLVPELMTLSMWVKRNETSPITFNRETGATVYIPGLGKLQESRPGLGEIVEKPMGDGWVHITKTVEVKRNKDIFDISLYLDVKEGEEVRLAQIETWDAQDATPWKDWF